MGSLFYKDQVHDVCVSVSCHMRRVVPAGTRRRGQTSMAKGLTESAMLFEGVLYSCHSLHGEDTVFWE